MTTACYPSGWAKTTREVDRFTVVVYRDLPRGSVVDEILEVLCDPLEESVLEQLGSNLSELVIAPPEDWAINQEPFVDPTGRIYPPGSVVQGEIGGGNNGITYTLRILYSRDDHLGPHEATVRMRIRDEA